MKGESRETSSDPPAISRSTDTERHVNKDSVHFVVHRELQNERVVYKNEQHVHNFTQELIQQRKDGFFCDVVIEVDGQRYWAHRAILAAGSAYFHAAFHSARPDNGDSNRQLQHMNLTTVDRGAFESVLYYIYSGDLLVSLATVSDLITVAGQLGVADVKQCCEFHMRKIIDINNWLDMYKICVMHNLEKLSMIVEDFIVTSFGVLAQEMELLQLPESYVQKILSRCNTERDNDIEGYILQVILKWVVFRYSDRVSCLDKLLSIVNAEILTKVHMDKILAIDAIQGHVILAQPNVMELLKEVKENDEKQKLEEERIRQEEEDFKMKEENSLREETHRLTIVEEEKAEKIKTHGGPVLNSNDSTNSHVANGAKSVSSDKNRKRLPIKKREDRTSHQMDAVTVKKENVSSEVIAAGENDSDTDTEWSEPLRKALLDLEQSTMKEEADGDKDATGRQSETKKQDQYPPKKRRKYVDQEAGDVLYSKVAPASSQEKTAKNCVGTPAVARTSARRKSSRPLKLVSHRTTRTSHTAAKTANATPKNALKKTSKSVTTCTQTIEVPGEVVPPGEENLLQEQKVKVENGLEPAPRKRRGRKPGGSMHQCGKCHRTFTTPSALRHHMKGHGSETPFLCEVCGFATIHFASINVHKKQHNGNKFRCTFKDCTYTSIRRSRLEDHMNAHEGIKNFVCSICGKAFAGRKHMQRHEKIHEAIKPVSCGECDYRTTRKDKLRDHVKRHHPATAVLRGYISAYDVNKVKAPRRTSHAKRAASRPETDAQSPTHQVMSTAVVPHLVGTPTISEDMIQYLTSLATSQLQQQQQQQQPVVGVFTPAMLAVTQPPVMSDQTAARQAPVNAATPVISTPETPAAHSNVQPPQSHVHTPQAHVLTQQTHAHTTQSHVQTPQRIMYVPQSHVQVPQALVRTALSQLQPPAHSQVAPQPSQLMTPQQIHVTPQPSHVAPQQSHVTPQQSNATPQQRYVTPQQSDVTQQAPWLYTLQQAQYSPYQQHAGQRQPAPVTPPCPVAPGAFKHNPS